MADDFQKPNATTFEHAAFDGGFAMEIGARAYEGLGDELFAFFIAEDRGQRFPVW